MKKFGLGKKSSDAGNNDEASSRSALFGSRSSKNSSPAPSASNPYAQPQHRGSPDPYAQDTNKYAGMGQSYGNPRAILSGGGGPAPPRGGHGMSGGSGPGDGDKYGGSSGNYNNRGGYGEDRFGRGGGAGAAPSGSRYGAGGYGGLGRSNSYDTTTTEDNRNALFDGAKDRYEQKSQGPPGQPGGGSEGAYGQAGGYDNADSGYGAYGEDRQLTAEEEEAEEVESSKQQIRFIKQQDVSSTANALRVAAQAEETGRSTLARLASQGERIHNTEKNLDLAQNHNRIAEERAKELKTLNKSMFAMHVANPFTKASRRRGRDDDILNKHRDERDQRENTRAAAFESKARMESAVRDVETGRGPESAEKQKSRLAERSKYQFEADSEDDEMENEIDRNLDALGGAAGTLNALARATGKEVDEQNQLIGKVTKKVHSTIQLRFREVGSIC
ncbi:MAG: Protein transport protein S9 plasma membrane t-SNARE [Sclerophora amabilis]|nr:MAG: Protein transport protein S9 plasma membrane t-SNARE [Sclerophora amabilis]